MSTKKKSAITAASTELDAAIVADPNDVTARLVYADWLQLQGDPRGELAMVQHAIDSAKGPAWAALKIREAELFARYANELYGPIVKWPRPRLTNLDWNTGFVSGFRSREPRSEAAVDAFFAHPSMKFVQHVDGFRMPPFVPRTLECISVYEGSLRALLAAPRLEALSCDHQFTEAKDIVHPTLELLGVGDVRAMLASFNGAQLPALKTLAVSLGDASLAMAAQVLPRVDELRIEADGLHESVRLAKLGALSARVTVLSLLHEVDPSGADLSGVKRLRIALSEGDGEVFGTLTLPALERVELQLPSDRVRFFRTFARSTLAKQIRQLAVRISTPAAGLALTEGAYDRLDTLEVAFDEVFPLELLQAERFVASDRWAKVKTLSCDVSLLPLVAGTMLGRSIETVRVTADEGRDFEALLSPFPQLKRVEVRGPRQFDAEAFTSLGSIDREMVWAPRVDALRSNT